MLLRDEYNKLENINHNHIEKCQHFKNQLELKEHEHSQECNRLEEEIKYFDYFKKEMQQSYH